MRRPEQCEQRTEKSSSAERGVVGASRKCVVGAKLRSSPRHELIVAFRKQKADKPRQEKGPGSELREEALAGRAVVVLAVPCGFALPRLDNCESPAVVLSRGTDRLSFFRMLPNNRKHHCRHCRAFPLLPCDMRKQPPLLSCMSPTYYWMLAEGSVYGSRTKHAQTTSTSPCQSRGHELQGLCRAQAGFVTLV